MTQKIKDGVQDRLNEDKLGKPKSKFDLSKYIKKLQIKEELE